MMKDFPKVNDEIVIYLSSPLLCSKRLNICTMSGKLSPTRQTITRTVEAVYSDGRVRDNMGEPWTVKATSSSNKWIAIA